MSDRLSFIFYEKARLPRYYEINRKIFHLALYGFPTISLLCLTGILLMGAYIKKIPIHIQKNETFADTSQLQDQNKTLVRENQELLQLNQQLQTKLAATPSSSKVGGIWIEGAPGSKKLPDNNALAIENPKVFIKNKRIHFHFNLSNQLKNKTRLKGFVHVIMKKGNKLFFWPSPSLFPQKLTAPYNSGEAFSTLYFRPVLSVFPLPTKTNSNNQEHLFFVTVHNNLGELIHQELVTPTMDGEEGP